MNKHLLSIYFEPDAGLVLTKMQSNRIKVLLPSNCTHLAKEMTRIHLKLINIGVTLGKWQGVLMNTLAILMGHTSGKASPRR